MSVLNYTTQIPASKTIAEMQTLLAKAGAATISVVYTTGQAAGMSFMLRTPHGERTFSLPVNVDAMQALLSSKWKAGRSLRHSGRVWRMRRS